MSFSEPTIQDVPAQLLAGIRKLVPMQELPAHYDRSFAELGAALTQAQVTPSGPPMGVSHGIPGDALDLTVGFPVAAPFPGDGHVQGVELPGGPAAVMDVIGDYSQLAEAYGVLLAWMSEQGHQPGVAAWEQYLSMPAPEGNPEENLTRITWLLQENASVSDGSTTDEGKVSA